jgi:histidinol phosphatase-like PHP family hydrolase
MIPKFNMHVHTLRSACAKPEMTLEAINEVASRAGLKYVGIADHIDVPEHNPRPILNREDIRNGTWDVEFLVGCEATVLSPGTMAVGDDVARMLDYVMVSANHYHLEQVENPADRSPEEYASHYLGMLEGVMDWGLADIVGHPFLHTKLGRRGVVDPVEVLDHYDWEQVERVLERAANSDLSFEVKPGYIEFIPEFMGRLVKAGREHGVRFSIGTDAHRLVEVPFPEGFGSKLEKIGLSGSDLIDPGDLMG